MEASCRARRSCTPRHGGHRRRQLARTHPVCVLRGRVPPPADDRRARHLEGDSYCGFCQAVQALASSAGCYAVDTWQGDEQSGRYGPEVLEELRAHHDPLYGSFSSLLQQSFDEAAAELRRRLDRSPARRRLPHLRGRCPGRRDVAAQAQRPGRAPAPRHERAQARVRCLAALGGARAGRAELRLHPRSRSRRARRRRRRRGAIRPALAPGRARRGGRLGFFAALGGERVAAPASGRRSLAAPRAAGGVRGAGTGDPHGQLQEGRFRSVKVQAAGGRPRSSGRRRTSSGGRRVRRTGCGASATVWPRRCGRASGTWPRSYARRRGG